MLVPAQPKLSTCSRITAFMGSPSVLVAGSVAVTTIASGGTVPVAAAAGIGMWALTKGVKQWFFGGSTLRPALFILEAELSNVLRAGGGVMELTIPPALSSLKKLNDSNDSSNYHTAVFCLENLLLYVDNFNYTGFGNGGLIDYQKKMIERLQPGETFALPCSYFTPKSGHIMVLSMRRKEGDIFTVTIFNGGEGAHYHAQKNNQIMAYEIEDVELENIFKILPHLTQLHACRFGNNTEKLYEKILPLLGKRSDVSKVLYDLQPGNSCSGYSVHLFLQAILSKEEYHEFEKQFCRESIKELTRGLTSTFCIWEHTRHHEVLLQALVGRLDFLENHDLENPAVPNGRRKTLFSHHTSLSKSTKLGALALRSQQFFWCTFFSEPRKDRECNIRGAYLVSALEEGERNFGKLTKLMEGGIDDNSRASALLLAAKNHDPKMFGFLYHSGKISFQNSTDRIEMLLYAMRIDNLEIVKSMMDRFDEYSRGSALLLAAKNHDPKMFLSLYYSGKSYFSSYTNQVEILLYAIRIDNLEIIKSMLDRFDGSFSYMAFDAILQLSDYDLLKKLYGLSNHKNQKWLDDTFANAVNDRNGALVQTCLQLGVSRIKIDAWYETVLATDPEFARIIKPEILAGENLPTD